MSEQATQQGRKLTPWYDRNMNKLYDGDVVLYGMKKYIIRADVTPDRLVVLLGTQIGNIHDTPDIMERIYV